MLLLSLSCGYQFQNLKNATYNIFLLIIDLLGIVSYYFVTLLCCCYPNDTFNKNYFNVANIRYNAFQIKNQVGCIVQNNCHIQF